MDLGDPQFSFGAVLVTVVTALGLGAGLPPVLLMALRTVLSWLGDALWAKLKDKVGPNPSVIPNPQPNVGLPPAVTAAVENREAQAWSAAVRQFKDSHPNLADVLDNLERAKNGLLR